MAPATLSAPRRSSLAREVLDRLRRSILRGDLPEGAPLPEAATAGRLGVSRVPVREALVQLEREGLVEFDVHGHTCVRSFSEADVREIMTLRSTLQTLAAREAAARVTADGLRRLQNILERAAETEDLAEFSALDTAFHDEVVVMARHTRLSRVWGELRAQMQLWLARLHRSRERVKHDVRQATFKSHRAFIRVLGRGRPAEAAAWMERHCNSWSRVLPELS